jgi:hypothetical protein
VCVAQGSGFRVEYPCVCVCVCVRERERERERERVAFFAPSHPPLPPALSVFTLLVPCPWMGALIYFWAQTTTHTHALEHTRPKHVCNKTCTSYKAIIISCQGIHRRPQTHTHTHQISSWNPVGASTSAPLSISRRATGMLFTSTATCVCVRARAFACVCVCVCVCVHACMCVCVQVRFGLCVCVISHAKPAPQPHTSASRFEIDDKK